MQKSKDLLQKLAQLHSSPELEVWGEWTIRLLIHRASSHTSSEQPASLAPGAVLSLNGIHQWFSRDLMAFGCCFLAVYMAKECHLSPFRGLAHAELLWGLILDTNWMIRDDCARCARAFRSLCSRRAVVPLLQENVWFPSRAASLSHRQLLVIRMFAKTEVQEWRGWTSKFSPWIGERMEHDWTVQ